ncbi:MULTISPECIES: helix-turn-helix domain-containing protein [Aestuariibaculum]|uniref:Helix-turn-helix domain-containing protein n=1 Tax=Aestuariibaculum lutulentum TaxID=2920935 RepID=A0ABS9REP7_9FLAO|nr:MULTISPECIES: helix-turn-helix domain-containing protein [Aestuariibaculum]MCH4551415.1 helix-turn-helix domain-containing protein [Aestuariibaculum lutulentum]MCR8666512.1 helix-turn-helix domain-containing protein [Aestuariibaculum sp. M13]
MKPEHPKSSAFKDEHWMTADEVQRFFKISRSTLYRWCKQKQLPYTTMGGTRYYPKYFTLNLMQHNMRWEDL